MDGDAWKIEPERRFGRRLDRRLDQSVVKSLLAVAQSRRLLQKPVYRSSLGLEDVVADRRSDRLDPRTIEAGD
jgi:hypothetical protein